MILILERAALSGTFRIICRRIFRINCRSVRHGDEAAGTRAADRTHRAAAAGARSNASANCAPISNRMCRWRGLPRRLRCRCGRPSDGSAATASASLAGHVRTGRADRGGRRRLHDDLRQLAEGLALQRPPLGPTAIYRELCRVAEARGHRPPRFSTVYSAVSALPEVLKTLAP